MKTMLRKLTLALLLAGLLPGMAAWAQSQTSASTVVLRNRGMIRTGGTIMDGGCGCAAPVAEAPGCGCDAAPSCGGCCDPCCLLRGLTSRIGSAVNSIFCCRTSCRPPLFSRLRSRGCCETSCNSDCGAATTGCGCGGGETYPGAVQPNWQGEQGLGTPPTPPSHEEARGYQLWNMPAPQGHVRTTKAPVISPTPAPLEEPLTLVSPSVTRTSFIQGAAPVTTQEVPANPLRN